MKPFDQLLSAIASEHLGISTLTIRRSDSLDFHDVAVWQVQTALTAAFEAGSQSAGKDAESVDATQTIVAPAVLSSPLFLPKGTPLVPGKMYLRLYHGRTDPHQEMDDWGFVGPTFGPLSCYVHTYCCTFRIHGADDTSEVWLEKHDDMIRWDGCFYGDLEVFVAGDDDRA